MNNFDTPMMKQYKAIKSKYPDCLLFYRMGDFYELFLEDAHIGAKVLNITLTGKSNGKNSRIPMAGVPYHAVDSYLAKLVKAGYKVAICEQLSPPSKKGLVDRDVVRIVTPGTIVNENILERKDNNYIIGLERKDSLLVITYADLSTGFFGFYTVSDVNVEQTLKDELAKINATECILPESLYHDPSFLKVLVSEKGLNIFSYQDWVSETDIAEKLLKDQFGVKTLKSFDIDESENILTTCASLLKYLQDTQRTSVSHIKKITHVSTTNHLVLDRATMINLELFSTIREHDKKGSLYHVLDHAKTGMGSRMLKNWIIKPLVDKKEIDLRLDAVEKLQEYTLQSKIDESLKDIPDIERIVSRLSVNAGNARDLVSLKNAISHIFNVKETLAISEDKLLKELSSSISKELIEVEKVISSVIKEEPSIDIKNGNIIESGVNHELDKLRAVLDGSQSWVESLEEVERKRTGINSLKIKFNKVFGYYIEVSKPNLHLVPEDYSRKQTLVNGERFTTPELKKHEDIILSAQEKINDLEYAIFIETLDKVLTYIDEIQVAARVIAQLDCLHTFAYISQKNGYVKPEISNSGGLKIVEGRHPVVEKLLPEATFVPNDIDVVDDSVKQLLITGPNMAGKSVYIRQIALIVLMAQMGCFVPASEAKVSIVDRIFVRSGASDVITSGLSTFMVEMVETAQILNNATKDSLIIMDEIGRGTSTYDGISIAWAVAEYLACNFNVPPITLFATHYHELQALETKYPDKISNFHMSVVDDNGSPVFLHTIQKGAASHSYGIAVAKLAGVPEDVVNNAKMILKELELRTSHNKQTSSDTAKLNLPKSESNKVYLIDKYVQTELENIDISRMTPLEALNTLAELKRKLSLFKDNKKVITAD